MSAHLARAGAVTRKELAELRRNRLIVVTAVMLPVIFLIGPTVTILSIKAPALSATLDKRVGYALFMPLMVSVLVPAVMSAYAVVGEREQGTLEPVLTTPVSRAELLTGKAAAIFMPAAVLGYLIFGRYVNPAMPALGFVSWLENWEWTLPVALMLFFLPLLFPDGKPISPRWWLVTPLVLLGSGSTKLRAVLVSRISPAKVAV